MNKSMSVPYKNLTESLFGFPYTLPKLTFLNPKFYLISS